MTSACSQHSRGNFSTNRWKLAGFIPSMKRMSRRCTPFIYPQQFKYQTLWDEADGEPEAIFKTSGTSEGLRGTHRLHSLAWYKWIATKGMAEFLYRRRNRPFRCWACPSPEEAPHSSLSRMANFAMEDRGTEDSCWGVRGGGVDFQRCRKWFETQASQLSRTGNGNRVLLAHLLDG